MYCYDSVKNQDNLTCRRLVKIGSVLWTRLLCPIEMTIRLKRNLYVGPKKFPYFMMTSSNGNISRITGHLCGEFTGPRWIPHTKASDAELWCFLWSRQNKGLSKQSWGWWFETQSCPLWRQCNVFFTLLRVPGHGIKIGRHDLVMTARMICPICHWPHAVRTLTLSWWFNLNKTNACLAQRINRISLSLMSRGKCPDGHDKGTLQICK